MDWANIHFWAKTTEDGQPGISVRDHCLNVGCVAEAVGERSADQLKVERAPTRELSFATGFPSGRSTPPRGHWQATKNVLQGHRQTRLVLLHRLLGQSIQWAAGTGVLFHFLVPNIVLLFVEPLRQFPKFLARELLDGGFDFRQRFHDRMLIAFLSPLNGQP